MIFLRSHFSEGVGSDSGLFFRTPGRTHLFGDGSFLTKYSAVDWQGTCTEIQTIIERKGRCNLIYKANLLIRFTSVVSG